MFILFYLVMVLPVIAVASAILYLPFWLIHKKRYGKQPFIRHLAKYGFVGFLLSLIYATLLIGMDFTYDGTYHFLNLIPFVWLKDTYLMGWQRMMEQLLMNVLMLVPFGFLLPVISASMRRCWKTVLLTAGLILVIEMIQYFIGRSADIDDLIMNTTGGLIGYGIYCLCNYWFRGRKLWQKACFGREKYYAIKNTDGTDYERRVLLR